jgi:hypothetical protein
MRPLEAIRAELDQEHAKRTAPTVRSAEAGSPGSAALHQITPWVGNPPAGGGRGAQQSISRLANEEILTDAMPIGEWTLLMKTADDGRRSRADGGFGATALLADVVPAAYAPGAIQAARVPLPGRGLGRSWLDAGSFQKLP